MQWYLGLAQELVQRDDKVYWSSNVALPLGPVMEQVEEYWQIREAFPDTSEEVEKGCRAWGDAYVEDMILRQDEEWWSEQLVQYLAQEPFAQFGLHQKMQDRGYRRFFSSYFRSDALYYLQLHGRGPYADWYFQAQSVSFTELFFFAASSLVRWLMWETFARARVYPVSCAYKWFFPEKKVVRVIKGDRYLYFAGERGTKVGHLRSWLSSVLNRSLDKVQLRANGTWKDDDPLSVLGMSVTYVLSRKRKGSEYFRPRKYPWYLRVTDSLRLRVESVDELVGTVVDRASKLANLPRDRVKLSVGGMWADEQFLLEEACSQGQEVTFVVV